MPNFDVEFKVPGGEAHNINVNAVFTSAYSSVLEVVYFSEANRLTETQLDTFSKCIDNAHAYALELFALKARIRNQEQAAIAERKKKSEEKKKQKEMATAGGGDTVVRKDEGIDDDDDEEEYVDDDDEFPSVIKLHLLGHLPEQIRELGANSQTFNASHGERSHQENVTWAFFRSSRNYDATLPEMCSAILTKEMGKRMCEVGSESKQMCEGASESEMPEKGEGSLSGDEDELIFETMPTLGKVRMVFSEENQTLERRDQKKEGIRFLHSLCTLGELFTVIKTKFSISRLRQPRESDYQEATDFVDWYKAFTQRLEGAELRLVGGVKCHGKEITGFKPCTFRANNQYKGRGSSDTASVFSSVQVNYGALFGEESFGKIMAIAVLRWNSTNGANEMIYIVVARYEKVTNKKTAKMPFEEYRLAANKQRTGGLKLDMVSVSTILPCFMQITNRDQVGHEATVHNFNRMSWFCLPMSRCVKEDNSSYDVFVKGLPSSVFKTADQIDEATKALGQMPKSLLQNPLSLTMIGNGSSDVGVSSDDGSSDEGGSSSSSSSSSSEDD